MVGFKGRSAGWWGPPVQDLLNAEGGGGAVLTAAGRGWGSQRQTVAGSGTIGTNRANVNQM